MELYLKGELHGESNDENEIIDWINEFIKESKDNKRVIKHCYVNGQDMPDFITELGELLKSGKVEKIELISIDQEELAVEILQTARDYLDNMSSYVRKVTQELGQGSSYEKSSLLKLIDGLEWLYNVSNNLSVYLESQKLKDFTEKFYTTFNEINESLESGDLPSFRDVLESRLLDNLDELKSICNEELERLENG